MDLLDEIAAVCRVDARAIAQAAQEDLHTVSELRAKLRAIYDEDMADGLLARSMEDLRRDQALFERWEYGEDQRLATIAALHEWRRSG